MNIQIISSKHQTYPTLGRYFFTEMSSGKHHITIVIAPDHLQAVVHNASNRAWRGLGKRFNSVNEALDHYKTPEVRSMIELAVYQAKAM